MKIIAMAGLAQTGKSTAAQYLAKRYGFAELALATPIKDLAAQLLGTNRIWIEKNKTTIPSFMKEMAPKQYITIRYILQTLGTEWGRNLIHKDLWINILLDKIYWYAQQPKPQDIVITDCRFNNEAIAIRKAGGIICHISRDIPPISTSHSSEEGGIIPHPTDFSCRNDGTLEQFYVHLDVMWNMYHTLIMLRR